MPIAIEQSSTQDQACSLMCPHLSRLLALLILAAALLAPTGVAASGISVGAPLPDLSIDDRGELVLSDDKVSYRSWRYPQRPGEVHIVQYLAATRSADAMNKPFRERMEAALPKGSVRTTTILNLDEAVWGTGAFVVSSVKSNKRKYPEAVIVLDEEGAGVEQWQLDSDSVAVMVVDREGTVRYIKQGEMSPEELDSAIELILAQISQPPSPAGTAPFPASQAGTAL